MNNIETICEKDNCTGCGACVSVCSQKCVLYEEDALDNIYPKIDQKKCVKCGQCRRVCPELNPVPSYNIKKCYAAWSGDPAIKENSASGGIASELYLYLIKNGYKVAGAMWSDQRVIFKISENIEDVSKFRNSKYVFSSVGACYEEISKLLKEGKKIFFVGLPCQVAAVKNYCKVTNADDSNLILADLVCHGVMASQYLISHVKSIEKKRGKRTEEIFFRDPQFGTCMFYFTLHDKKGIFYKKQVKSNDCYQIAYHKALSYRENCYHCKYACRNRNGDLSLCDFTAVGTLGEFEYTNENVSCVMVNTNKGEKLWYEILASGRVWAEERPIEEITDYEKQLNFPSKKHKSRSKFENEYIKSKNFEIAACHALFMDILWNMLNFVLPLRRINDFRKRIKHR